MTGDSANTPRQLEPYDSLTFNVFNLLTMHTSGSLGLHVVNAHVVRLVQCGKLTTSKGVPWHYLSGWYTHILRNASPT